ncbi:pyroglutamyl-peptidase I [Ottowia sp.]|uniref:pyroglutamyl-peptidase I n=1 Tax=Ottowia sp. TaxID=1898956 RepID=UPI0034243D6F
MRKVLLTGFEPFGGDALNPSWLAAQALRGRRIAGHRVVAAQLPTVFGASLERLDALLHQHRPALVVCLGLAAGRAALSLERVAINVQDARMPDNAGAEPVDAPVVPGGPAAYFSTLPIKAMRAAVQAAGVPAEVSQTAGTFVCNHVFYGLMHRLATEPALAGARGGFVHVPLLPEQGTPSLALEDQVKGLRAAIAAALAQSDGDLRQAAGAIS